MLFVSSNFENNNKQKKTWKLVRTQPHFVIFGVVCWKLQYFFENYSQYLQDFQNEISPNFRQWINGSFVTNRTNPKDIGRKINDLILLGRLLLAKVSRGSTRLAAGSQKRITVCWIFHLVSRMWTQGSRQNRVKSGLTRRYPQSTLSGDTNIPIIHSHFLQPELLDHDWPKLNT